MTSQIQLEHLYYYEMKKKRKTNIFLESFQTKKKISDSNLIYGQTIFQLLSRENYFLQLS